MTLIKFNRAVAAIEEFLLKLAGAATLIIMMIVSADVFMRYLMHRPFSWSYDLIGLNLVPLAFFLALSATFSRNTHISVDILYLRFADHWQRVVRMAIAILTLPMAAWIVWLSAIDAEQRWAKNEIIAGVVRWPTWIPAAIVTVGFFMLALRLALDLIALVRALVANDPATPGESVERTRSGHREVEPL